MVYDVGHCDRLSRFRLSMMGSFEAAWAIGSLFELIVAIMADVWCCDASRCHWSHGEKESHV